MHNKRKNTGAPIIIFGAIAFMICTQKMDFEKLRKVDIMLLVSIGVFISCGIYAMIRSRKKV